MKDAKQELLSEIEAKLQEIAWLYIQWRVRSEQYETKDIVLGLGFIECTASHSAFHLIFAMDHNIQDALHLETSDRCIVTLQCLPHYVKSDDAITRMMIVFSALMAGTDKIKANKLPGVTTELDGAARKRLLSSKSEADFQKMKAALDAAFTGIGMEANRP